MRLRCSTCARSVYSTLPHVSEQAQSIGRADRAHGSGDCRPKGRTTLT